MTNNIETVVAAGPLSVWEVSIDGFQYSSQTIETHHTNGDFRLVSSSFFDDQAPASKYVIRIHFRDTDPNEPGNQILPPGKYELPHSRLSISLAYTNHHGSGGTNIVTGGSIIYTLMEGDDGETYYFGTFEVAFSEFDQVQSVFAVRRPK